MFPGALQSGLNSRPCPIQLAPALSKNLNGKWRLSANPYPSKSRVKEKTRQNHSTPAEIRLGLGYDAALTWARHCARCGHEHCLLLISQLWIESGSVKFVQGPEGNKALFIIIGSPLSIHLALPGITWWAFMLFTAYKKVVLLWFNI